MKAGDRAAPDGSLSPVSPRALAKRIPAPIKEKVAQLILRLGYETGPRAMSEARKRWVALRHPGSTIRFHPSARVGPGFSVEIRPGGTLIVGPDVEIRRNFRAELTRRDARIVIGKGSVIGHNVIFGCSTSIELGERVIIGPQVYLSDGSHDYSADIKKAFLDRGYRFQPVRLGDDSAVATHCTVTASIGERSMVSANSLVRKPVPPYYALGGVPARLARYFGPEGEEPEDGRRERLAWEADRLARKIEQAESQDERRAEPAA